MEALPRRSWWSLFTLHWFRWAGMWPVGHVHLDVVSMNTQKPCWFVRLLVSAWERPIFRIIFYFAKWRKLGSIRCEQTVRALLKTDKEWLIFIDEISFMVGVKRSRLTSRTSRAIYNWWCPLSNSTWSKNWSFIKMLPTAPESSELVLDSMSYSDTGRRIDGSIIHRDENLYNLLRLNQINYWAYKISCPS